MRAELRQPAVNPGDCRQEPSLLSGSLLSSHFLVEELFYRDFVTLGFPLKQRLSPHVKGSRVSLILGEGLTSHLQGLELSFTFGQDRTEECCSESKLTGAPISENVFYSLFFGESNQGQGYLLLSGILNNKSIVCKLFPPPGVHLGV